MHVRTVAAAFAALLLSSVAGNAAEPQSPAAVLKQRPAMAQAWRAVVPKTYQHQEWVSRLLGNSNGPLYDIMHDHRYLTGRVCKPGDCMNHVVAFAIRTDGRRATGLVENWDGARRISRVEFGNPDPAEKVVIEGALSDLQHF